VGTHIESPGVVTQKGGDGKILFGKDPEHPEFYPSAMIDLLTGTGIKYEYLTDPYPAIWEKYMFISAFGLTGVYTGKTLGEMLDNDECKAMLYDIMTEINLIACKKGICLRDSIVEDSIVKGKKFPYEAKTSYQRDVELKGKPDEGELFGGTILRLGKELGIETPVTEMLYKKIKEAKS
jgi:2-dehydropantoate 2-reductase